MWTSLLTKKGRLLLAPVRVVEASKEEVSEEEAGRDEGPDFDDGAAASRRFVPPAGGGQADWGSYQEGTQEERGVCLLARCALGKKKKKKGRSPGLLRAEDEGGLVGGLVEPGALEEGGGFRVEALELVSVVGFPLVVEDGGVGFEEGNGEFGEEFHFIDAGVVALAAKVGLDLDVGVPLPRFQVAVADRGIFVAQEEALVVIGVGELVEEAAPRSPQGGVAAVLVEAVDLDAAREPPRQPVRLEPRTAVDAVVAAPAQVRPRLLVHDEARRLPEKVGDLPRQLGPRRPDVLPERLARRRRLLEVEVEVNGGGVFSTTRPPPTEAVVEVDDEARRQLALVGDGVFGFLLRAGVLGSDALGTAEDDAVPPPLLRTIPALRRTPRPVHDEGVAVVGQLAVPRPPGQGPLVDEDAVAPNPTHHQRLVALVHELAVTAVLFPPPGASLRKGRSNANVPAALFF
eukprot:CAMPEP_0118901694 /NCGR_PEP_ID=MMETSP1166-20130328/7293_1 /TAXON_ID=1104430 /ORGANISM="Chrysoreinhardia sp, Strain CCMP3193" /LENGTH=458 /DNA_ID=CAMNT_0006840877 /DNA_START=1 /DNA_END=1379 /DNA_ORIENTATION=+